MPDRPTPTVAGLLAELHAYRVQTMAPAALAANIDQRRLLEETADRDAFVKAGDVVEPFTLPEVLGGTVLITAGVGFTVAPLVGVDLGAGARTTVVVLPQAVRAAITATAPISFRMIPTSPARAPSRR